MLTEETCVEKRGLTDKTPLDYPLKKEGIAENVPEQKKLGFSDKIRNEW